MIDTSHINIEELIGIDVPLKKVSKREYCGPCPFCGGDDRFRVWPEEGRYWCRQCEAKGDAIQYLQDRDNLSFPEALVALRIPLQSQPYRQSKPVSSKPLSLARIKYDVPALADEQWQAGAQVFIKGCQDLLWSTAGTYGLDYLNGRCLPDHIIRTAGLGFNPTAQSRWWGDTKVWLAHGMIIPWIIDGRIWRINIRLLTDVKNNRYKQPKGCANGLYGADLIKSGYIDILVEGEFDALVLRHHVPQLVTAATGSVSGARSIRWIAQINLANQVLLAFDADDDGDHAAEWWQEKLGSKAVRLRPTQHDVTEMVKAGEDLVDWVSSVLDAPIPTNNVSFV